MVPPLPDWLEHLDDLPDRAVVVDQSSQRVVWVTARLADDNGRDRNCFEGRLADGVEAKTAAGCVAFEARRSP